MRNDRRRARLAAGARDTIPMIVGATPFGLIFGTLAVGEAGLSLWGTVGLSALVFAGSSQFVAVGLLTQGAGVAVIVITTFVVNLRHALYGASLAPYMRRLPATRMIPLAFLLTDETYATVIETWRTPEKAHAGWYHLGSALLMYLNWNVWTLVGALAGSGIAGVGEWGLDFAMVVTFIGIVVPLIRDRSMLVCALSAGAVGLVTYNLPHNLGLIAAAVSGIAMGVLADRASHSGSRPKQERS
jgi:4-azaleucine resistance transporter AzlC